MPWRIQNQYSRMSSQSSAITLQSHIQRRFTVLKKVGSGAYGHVWKVEQKGTGRILALKKIFDAFQHATDAQRTYRQIQILRQLDHQNIIKLHDTIKAQNGKDVYLLFEYMQADLHNVISEGILKDIHSRYIISQIARALKYLHSARLIHRDLKPSNVLVNSNCAIKLCDFGLVRSLKARQQAVLTEGVATRWYRSPEVLLGSKSYSTPADIWSLGCIIYEMLAQKPLFPGSCTLDQIEKICAFTGYPTEEDIASLDSEISSSLIKEMKVSSSANSTMFLKDFAPQYIDLLQKMLIFNPKKRITIEQILEHQVVKDFHKPQQQIICEKQITTALDDNKKVTVEQYRRLIYGQTPNDPKQAKSKALSSSLGAGSISPKYQPLINKSTVNFSSNKLTPPSSITKKFSYDQPKQAYQPQLQEKKPLERQRPLIKYVRSATNIPKQAAYSQYPQRANYDIPNREQTDPYQQPYQQPYHQSHYPTHNQQPYFNPQIQSKYVSNAPKIQESPKLPYGFPTQQNYGPQQPTNHAWKAVKSPCSQAAMTANQIKQKVLQFRSAKYPITHKGQAAIKAGISNLHEGKN